MHVPIRQKWKNPSVKKFAAGEDPISLILQTAGNAALNAMQEGWHGPPFDPFALAELRNIPVVPNDEVLDARTIPLSNGRFRIEYNPSRPRARIRYSIAHEIAHTFFDDCAADVRNRATRAEFQQDEWELEMLCNLGASELLMPTGSLDGFSQKSHSIREILELRKRFEVSTESILLRLTRVTRQPYTMFAASCPPTKHGRYSIDYCISSRAASARMHELRLPNESIVSACTASGFTAIADENWPGIGKVHVECVGISPYPGHVYPRVVGLLMPTNQRSAATPEIRFVVGDATKPHGTDFRILAHVVNNATPNWGAGFGRVVQQKWPDVQDSFRKSWGAQSRNRLGEVYFSNVDKNLMVCQMICQHGYGTSNRPRIRYAALRECLFTLKNIALMNNASVHMPTIGTGEAGGSWQLVSALIDEVLCAAGLSVTIYDLPKQDAMPRQRGLFD